jgi:hypothetical protein
MHTTDMDALAARLAGAAPHAGPLDEVDFGMLSASGRIDALVACARHLSRAHALMVRALGALDAARDDGSLIDCTEVEVGVALRWAPSVTQARLAEAGTLTRVFPETVEALGAGAVSFEQARILAEATSTLGDHVARAVQDRVLPRMPHQTLAATRRAVARAVHRLDPDGAAARHQQQRTRRCIQVRPLPDAMATLELYAPADTVAAMAATLTRLASERAEGDTRTLGQRRADTLANLVLAAAGVRATGTSEPVVPALVHVVVAADTLLSDGDEPGELSGHGPITADRARQLAFAPGSRWRWLLAAGDGTLLHAAPRTYTPTKAVARFVRLRDRTCSFPHCHMPAARCDLDHTVAFTSGGLTTSDNLHPLCRHHHGLKTRNQWSVHSQADGRLRWTAPTGHAYTGYTDNDIYTIEGCPRRVDNSGCL